MFLSLGDREVGRAVEFAARYGGGLGDWRRALRECNVSLEKYTRRKDVSELLSWDHVRVGLNKRFLIEDSERVWREAAAHV